MSDCKYTRERCQVCDGKAVFRSKADAEKEIKRMGRYKSMFKGLKAYRGDLCHVWHIGDGGDHKWRKVSNEKASRRKDWL